MRINQTKDASERSRLRASPLPSFLTSLPSTSDLTSRIPPKKGELHRFFPPNHHSHFLMLPFESRPPQQMEGQTLQSHDGFDPDQTPREEGTQFFGAQLQPAETQQWPPRLYALSPGPSSDGLAVSFGAGGGTEEGMGAQEDDELGRYAPLGCECSSFLPFVWLPACWRKRESSPKSLSFVLVLFLQTTTGRVASQLKLSFG